ncbi:MAG TPA: TonB-dependent receptor [Thermoanaerobaculia bacterium]
MPLVLLLLLLTPTLLFAQATTGTLVGTVTSDGSALPGVTVTVQSPALQGTRSTITGEAGGYHLPALPPGRYTVTFSVSGMQSVQKTVTLAVAQNARADAEMRVAAIEEAMTVTATAPAAAEVTEVSTNFTSTTINELPVGRTVDDTVRLAPGVTEAGPNDQITISGANSFDNLFLVNGVVVNENLRGQPNALYIEDAIQESTVLSAGVSAEFGRFTGGVVSTITKSGGNDFTGSLRDTLDNPSWVSKTDYAAQAEPIDDLNSTYEGTLGGRIIRDRLWFFGAARMQDREQTRQTVQTNIPYVFSSEDERFEAKLTAQLTQNHSVIGSYIKSDEGRDNYVTSGRVIDLRSLTTYERPKSLEALHYTGVLTNNFLIEGQYARMQDEFTSGAESRDLIQGTLLLDSATGNRMWSPTFCGTPCPAKERDNESWLGKASYFLSTRAAGNHSFVGGYEEFHQIRNENNFQSGSDFRIHGNIQLIGGQVYFGVDPNRSEIEYDPVPALSSTSDFAVRSVFLNDKLELNQHFNFNIGVRYDQAFGTDQAGRKTVDDSAFSPRLAAQYDLKGDGRHRFSTSYGRYVSKVDQGPADNTATAGRYASYYWDYKGPAINPIGTPAGQMVPIEQVIRQVFDWFNSVGGTRNTEFLTSAHVPGVTTRFDRSLSAPFMDEWTLGYAMTFGSRGFVRADFINRNWGDFYVSRRTIETGKAVDGNGTTFDQSVIENSDDGLSRKYQGIQLQGSFRASPALNFGGNYTWSKLRGNVEGESASFATTLTDYNWYPEYTTFDRYAPVGYLGADMRHRANLWAQYDLSTPVGRFNFSALQGYHSALSYSATATIDIRRGVANGPADGITNPGYQTPPTSVNYFFSDRGELRLDDIFTTDIGINWYSPTFRGIGFFVETDILNVFNLQGVEDPDFINKTVTTRRSGCRQGAGTAADPQCVAFNPYTTAPVEGVHYRMNAAFGQPINEFAYQTPRTFRVSLGLKF